LDPPFQGTVGRQLTGSGWLQLDRDREGLLLQTSSVNT